MFGYAFHANRNKHNVLDDLTHLTLEMESLTPQLDLIHSAQDSSPPLFANVTKEIFEWIIFFYLMF